MQRQPKLSKRHSARPAAVRITKPAPPPRPVQRKLPPRRAR